MSTVDQKIKLLNTEYGDSFNAQTAAADVEDIRSRAKRLGIFTSIAIFGFNEVARLAIRSRKSWIFYIQHNNTFNVQHSLSLRSKTSYFSLLLPPFSLDINTTKQLRTVSQTCGVFTKLEQHRVLEVQTMSESMVVTIKEEFSRLQESQISVSMSSSKVML